MNVRMHLNVRVGVGFDVEGCCVKKYHPQFEESFFFFFLFQRASTSNLIELNRKILKWSTNCDMNEMRAL